MTTRKKRREQHDRPLEERVAYYRAQNRSLAAQNQELRRQNRALRRLRERAEDLVNTARLFLEEIEAINPRPIHLEPDEVETYVSHGVYAPVQNTSELEVQS